MFARNQSLVYRLLASLAFRSSLITSYSNHVAHPRRKLPIQHTPPRPSKYSCLWAIGGAPEVERTPPSPAPSSPSCYHISSQLFTESTLHIRGLRAPLFASFVCVTSNSAMTPALPDRHRRLTPSSRRERRCIPWGVSILRLAFDRIHSQTLDSRD